MLISTLAQGGSSAHN